MRESGTWVSGAGLRANQNQVSRTGTASASQGSASATGLGSHHQRSGMRDRIRPGLLLRLCRKVFLINGMCLDVVVGLVV